MAAQPVDAAALKDFHKLSCKTLKGEPFNFSELQGKVVLIVNVASQCGFTKQYSALQGLYDTYKDRNFTIIGFPCNQFGGQEPGNAEEIAEFCSRNYQVTFPIMEKIEVNGDNTHPVYAFLKAQKSSMFMERIKWNFEKFLINKDGTVVERYISTTGPERIEKDIQPLL